MPIYEYECAKCKTNFEVERKITDKGSVKCPNCGSKKTERLISQTSFRLSGQGWYATDYSNKHKKESLKEQATGTSTSTPAPKTETKKKETSKAI